MKVVRFSAVEMFGVPMDNADDFQDIPKLRKLMGAYGIEGTDVTTDLVDITPYYWEKNVFRYYLSRKSPDGPAVIDIMPRFHDSAAYLVASLSRDRMVAIETPERTIEVPTDMEAMAVAGPGPRFLGQICVHELIAAVI